MICGGIWTVASLSVLYLTDKDLCCLTRFMKNAGVNAASIFKNEIYVPTGRGSSLVKCSFRNREVAPARATAISNRRRYIGRDCSLVKR